MARTKKRVKHTVAQARNSMRRAVEQIVDPGPADVAALWEHFDSQCAYCGVDLVVGSADAHIDHADPDGGNHLGNQVLSCRWCNGDDKREERWRDFLFRAVADPNLRAERQVRIESWIAQNPPPIRATSDDVDRIRAALAALSEDFAVKCAELRAAVRAANDG